MKPKLIQQYLALGRALETEKAQILTRIAEIDRALGQMSGRPRGRPPGSTRPKARASAPRAGRHGNATSLKQLILQVTSKSPLSRKEILTAVEQAGYKFTSKNPLNSLSTILYTASELKNYGGKFGPAY
ncbi:MAG TPA: hypothetical protein VMF06_17115 [Candidatus Limnocylindria bacterium]|jgi:hypothetical protein|nr:hypothetical protein [Candidatus Limnocylindria bacterium]